MSTSIGSSSGAAVTFSGLGSGIDTASIVEKLMSLERQPITKLQSDKTKVNAEKSVVQSLNTLITTLRDRASDLLSSTAFSLRTSTSSNNAVLTTTAGTGAARGSFDVVVSQLAKAHTLASGGTTSGVGAGALVEGETLTVGVGTKSVSLTIAAGETLQSLADRINAAADTPVAASVVTSGAASKLMLVSRTTGSAGGMTVSGTAAASLDLQQTQAAQDAALTVNSVPVTATGNTVTGAISGVTLNLTGAGASTVKVDTDATGIQAKIQAFVDAYNGVVDYVKQATRYDSAAKQAGVLQGDQAITQFAGQLRLLAGSAVGALTSPTEQYDSLAQIGITSNRDGRLTLDATKLQAALTADPQRVAAVFGTDNGDGKIDTKDGIAVRIKDFTNSYATGVLTKRLTGYSEKVARMDKKIADLEVVMTLRENRLKAQFAAMEKAVSQFQSEGDWLSQQFA